MGFVSGMQGSYDIRKSIIVIHHTNKIKDNDHMIMSIDLEIVSDKTEHPFLIKILSVGTEGIYLNIIKAIYDKLTAYNSILKGENLKPFS